MTISKTTAIGASLAILIVGLLVGRFATPTKILEKDRIVSVDREIETHIAAYVGHTEIHQSSNTVWMTREVRKPDGTVVIETKTKQETENDTIKDEKKQEIVVKEVVKYQEIEKIKLIESPKERIFLAATAGLDSLKKEGLLVGGQINVRIAGPFIGGVWAHVKPADGSLASGLAVGFTF